MDNNAMIEYLRKVKQRNLDDITDWQRTLTTLDEAVGQMNYNIDNYNAQKIDFQQKVATAESGNILIDQTIEILSA